MRLPCTNKADKTLGTPATPVVRARVDLGDGSDRLSGTRHGNDACNVGCNLPGPLYGVNPDGVVANEEAGFVECHLFCQHERHLKR